ncbi:MAG: DUF4097 family beta strand repeat protein [Anaerolineaceae bacterium]|nr:DUF4097 family beta strand repeat protein [Anaerolineaceae bacterium]
MVFSDEGTRQENDTLTLFIPKWMNVSVETYSADANLIGEFQRFHFSSIAGTIEVDDFTGQGIFRSGRGDILIKGGSGSIKLIGEHGFLSVKNFLGQISTTTIMGKTELLGAPNESQQISLEADHGNINIALHENSNLSILIKSPEGYVTCVGDPGLRQTSDGCEGVLKSGEGILYVRTVSGDVRLSIFK